MNRTSPLLILLLTAAAHAQAAPTPLTLPGAVTRALNSGVDVATARATLRKAESNLRAVRADPTSLRPALTQAEQDVLNQTAALSAAKLATVGAAVQGYVQAFEGARRADLSAAQVALDTRLLSVAQARLAARVATALDVSRAQSTLNSDRQELADTRAQLPLLEAALVRTMNLPAGTNLRLSPPPAAPKLSLSLSTLLGGLDRRLNTLVQADGAAQLAALQVRLAQNDYTPARTLEDAQVALANAQRGREDAVRAAQTGVRDAYRAVQDAQQRVEIARDAAANARTALAQAQARLNAGTAAAVEVQQTQVQAQQAELGIVKAQGGVWKALGALGSAAGMDVTGMVK